MLRRLIIVAAVLAGLVYAGGDFYRVGGDAQRGLAQLRVDTGARVPAFTAAINNGDVRSLVANGPWLYAGGARTSPPTARTSSLSAAPASPPSIR